MADQRTTPGWLPSEDVTLARLNLLRSRVANEPELQPVLDLTIMVIQGKLIVQPTGRWTKEQQRDYIWYRPNS